MHKRLKSQRKISLPTVRTVVAHFAIRLWTTPCATAPASTSAATIGTAPAGSRSSSGCCLPPRRCRPGRCVCVRTDANGYFCVRNPIARNSLMNHENSPRGAIADASRRKLVSSEFSRSLRPQCRRTSLPEPDRPYRPYHRPWPPPRMPMRCKDIFLGWTVWTVWTVESQGRFSRESPAAVGASARAGPRRQPAALADLTRRRWSRRSIRCRSSRR
jgi:hypothetical protein